VIVVGGFNTALDKLAETDAVEPATVMRLRRVRTLPGGKGLHVALACATLGAPATLVGLIDEPNRALFETTLADANARFVGVTMPGPVRTCLAVRDALDRTTEFLEPGPDVSSTVAAALLDAFRREANSGRMVVLSGSLPAGMPLDTYASLIDSAGRDRMLLDTSGDALRAGLSAAPLVVKPNRQEAADIVGFAIQTLADATRAAALIAARGPRIVVLSLGPEGAVIGTDQRTWHVAAPAVVARNTVGSGDCLLAGLAVGLMNAWPIEQCARYGVACGTAKAIQPDTGLFRRADVDDVMRGVAVTMLSGC
jgi:1-phosphofructokinase family hexose kinase